jgi:hypothetical protein
MSLRWRNHCEGEILCAAKHPELPNDCYIDDGLHYQLAVLSKVIVPDENEHTNGLWHWNLGGISYEHLQDYPEHNC